MSRLIPQYSQSTQANLERIRIDALVAKHTAFKSLEQVANQPCYFPSLRVSNRERKIVADAYDKFQAARGDRRRASRFH